LPLMVLGRAMEDSSSGCIDLPIAFDAWGMPRLRNGAIGAALDRCACGCRLLRDALRGGRKILD
jgi:hypothetical protein